MAAGKTAVGRELAARLALPFVDLDRLIEQSAGATIPELFDRDGEEAFRRLEAAVLAEVAAGPPAVVATGGGAPCFHGGIDVMRREAGYGESYGERRSGEWEYASYRPDGSFLQPIEKSASCAECHQTASASRDFVFRGRFPPLRNE